MAKIRNYNVETRYVLEGAGTPLVLLRGVGSRLKAWDGVAAQLRDRFQLLRYDLRGHGESEKVPGPYEIEDFAEDLRALTDALRLAAAMSPGFRSAV